MKWFVYALTADDLGVVYIGCTKNPRARLRVHNKTPSNSRLRELRLSGTLLGMQILSEHDCELKAQVEELREIMTRTGLLNFHGRQGHYGGRTADPEAYAALMRLTASLGQ